MALNTAVLMKPPACSTSSAGCASCTPAAFDIGQIGCCRLRVVFMGLEKPGRFVVKLLSIQSPGVIRPEEPMNTYHSGDRGSNVQNREHRKPGR